MLAVTLIFTLFLGLSLVSASDIDIDDTVSLSDNNNVQTSSSSIAIDDVEDNDDDESKYSNPTVASTNAGDGEIVKDSSNSGTISELNETINSGASSIVLDYDYTYNEGTDSRFINIGGIVINRDLTIDGQGHTIDLGGKIRFLNVTGYSITLKNINIINGYTANNGGAIYIYGGNGSITNSTFTNNTASYGGGAIYIEDGTGSITNSTFTDNYVDENGGAIYIESGNGNIINSTFYNNNANENGGAIYINGNGSITNSTFTNNNATYNGGAIYINGNGSITNSTFKNNNARSFGGAIYIERGTGSITNSTFTNNNANRYGGAIVIFFGNGSIINSTFTNNKASFSGAISIYKSNGCITNSRFTNNTAYRYGGAIYITNNGNGSIINSTFTNNNANDGGAIHIDESTGSIINSTFTNNNANDGGAIHINGNGIGSIINSTFTNNNANDGGAICIDGGTGSIINSTFTNNNANRYGGAIFYKSGILNVTNSRFNDNFGNIVYYDTNYEIYVDSATRSLSDPDLICNHTDLSVQLNNYTYGSNSSIFCNVSSGDETIYGSIYVVIGNITYTGYIHNCTGTIYLPDNISAGNYTLDIIYNGTGGNSWAKSRALANLIVYKKDVDMNVSASNITYTEDGLVNVSFNQAVEGLAYINYDNKTYSINISGDSGVITVPGLMPGVYIFDVYFDSLNYNASMKTVSFTVFKKDPVMDVSVANITYGEDAVIFVNFAEKLNCTVYVICNNFNYTGNITDGKGNITIKGLNAGDYSLNVVFDETILYNATSAPAIFTIFKANSTISVTADDADYDDDVLVNVTTDCEDGDIFLVINDKTYTGYIHNGVGIINVAGLEPGYYSTNVTYNGSINYNPCVSPVNFTVNKLTPKLIISSIDINGRDVSISIVTTGDDSVAYVIINDVTYSTNIVNLTGVINITGLKPGNYSLNLTYNGTKYYNPCDVPVNFTINKIPTSISASDATYVLNYANVYKVTFNPKLAGFNITFTLNGKIVGSAITDASGVARINLTAAQLKAAGAGKRNMLVSFAGDDTYLASNVTKTITINKEATKFINVKSVKKSYKSTDKSMQLTATLKNSKNKVIKNQVVYFKVNNKKTYKVKTNSKGVAKLTLNLAKIKACKLNKKGNYKFTVTYKTTATYKQASKNGTLKVL